MKTKNFIQWKAYISGEPFNGEWQMNNRLHG